jgi:hypothetical protein
MDAVADLAREATAELEHPIPELLALLVVHELVGELVLEGSEAPERGAAALGDGDPHREKMLASETAAVKLEVRADTLLALAVEDVIGALAVL